MAQFLGFGDGSGGDVVLSGGHSYIGSACTGSAGSQSLAATNPSFAAGQFVWIHQTLNGTPGTWELGKIESYVPGTITLTSNLENSYVGGAQVLVVPQYRSVTIDNYTIDAYSAGAGTGGFLVYMCTGKTTISGSGLIGAGRGFAGGASVSSNSNGNTGTGPGAGGGGQGNAVAASGGGGAGHASAGSSAPSGGGLPGGVGGSTYDSADGVTFNLGSGGGSGGAGQSGGSGGGTSGAGGAGGASALLFTADLEITAAVNLDATAGAAPSGSGNIGGSGGGSGGMFVAKTRKTTDYGTSKISVAGGGFSSGIGASSSTGNQGAEGRIRIEGCEITAGSSSPAASESEGGFSYCSFGGQIF